MEDSASGLLVLKALAQAEPVGMSRSEVMVQTGLSHASFYRAVRPLLESRRVSVEGNRYRLPLDSLYNFRLKLWHDAERLEGLAPEDSSQILEVLRQARLDLGDNLRALWLVGSAAHGELHPGSDLDFLVVVRKDRLYHPTATRPVQFVMMTEPAFKDAYFGGDAFVQQAVRHGVLLADMGMAQDFYAQLASGFPQGAQAEREETVEKQRERLSFFLQQDAMDEARQTLVSIAVSTARLLLRQFGEDATTKTDLVHRVQLLFGPHLVSLLKRAMSEGAMGKQKMVQIARELDEYYGRALQHMAHLKSFAGLPKARAVVFEALVGQVLEELLRAERGTTPTSRDQGVDLVLRRSKETYIVQCKSTVAALSTSDVQRLVAALPKRRAHLHPILVVNASRDLPITHQGAAYAKQQGVHILTGLDLLRAHNRAHLEDFPLHLD